MTLFLGNTNRLLTKHPEIYHITCASARHDLMIIYSYFCFQKSLLVAPPGLIGTAPYKQGSILKTKMHHLRSVDFSDVFISDVLSKSVLTESCCPLHHFPYQQGLKPNIYKWHVRVYFLRYLSPVRAITTGLQFQ